MTHEIPSDSFRLLRICSAVQLCLQCFAIPLGLQARSACRAPSLIAPSLGPQRRAVSSVTFSGHLLWRREIPTCCENLVSKRPQRVGPGFFWGSQKGTCLKPQSEILLCIVWVWIMIFSWLRFMSRALGGTPDGDL